MALKRFTVFLSPFLRSGRSIKGMVLATIACLMPATAFGMIQFGLNAVLLVVCAIVAAVATEALVSKLSGEGSTIKDYHAALVGLMLALLLPAGTPWWVVVVGAVTGVLVGKMPFGPLGGSPLSPALVGLLIITLSWHDEVTQYTAPYITPSDVAAAGDDQAPAPVEDPLMAVNIDPSDAADYSHFELFLGHYPGLIGGVSPLFILVGGLLLIALGAARWQGPLGFILGVLVTAAISHGIAPQTNPDALFQLFTGGAMFGAFFLCTEWSTTPVTHRGLFVYGVFAGALMILFRLTGMAFGSVAYAVAISSLATPLFDRIAVVPFGKGVNHA